MLPTADNMMDESVSLAPCTKKMRILPWNSNKPGFSLVYVNFDKNEKLVGRNAIYSDIYMHRQNKDKKREELHYDAAVRRKTINEMESRIKSLVISTEYKMETKDTIWNTFLVAAQKTNEEMIRYWKKIDQNLSPWEIFLIIYAGNTGEMQNHQAMGLHVDGNRSHFAESMTMWGKVPKGCTENKNSLVRKMTPGIVSIPLLGMGIRLRCGRDVMHCQFTETMHCADPTRYDLNWSWVHGP
jgi:hypothetical protein